MLGSALVGWTALGLAVATRGWTRGALLAVATCALYRSVLFIHEITHLNARDVPWFRGAWNAVVGVPLLIPSFLYEGVHTDHHRQRTYGTAADPEYVPYARRRAYVLALSVAAAPLAPLFLAFRFAVLAPLSWIVPPLRAWVRRHASALVINLRYVRRVPFDRAARIEEVAACGLVWTLAALWWIGRVPAALPACWVAAAAAASLANAIRTMAAHRYDHDEDELDMLAQLLDSCTIAPHGGLPSSIADLARALVAPVGLRYHALHHWIPSLPYHNLGRAHRRLTAAVRRDAPYRATFADGFTPLIRDLVHRSRAHS